MDTRKSSLPPWEADVYNKELDSNIRFPNAESPAHFHEKTSSQNLEELARQKELNEGFTKQYRFENQDELLGERFGRILHHREFLRLLRMIRPAYLQDSKSPGMAGLAVLMPSETGGQWQYVSAIQLGYVPEYSMLHLDSHGLPLNERFRGWRTVLLRLIQVGAITEQQADEIFGQPTSGPISRRYREQLYGWRNRPQI